MYSQYILAALPPDERKGMKAPAEPGLCFSSSNMPSNTDGALDWQRHSVVHVHRVQLRAAERLRSTGGLANGTDSLIVYVFNESLSYRSAVSNGSCSNRKAVQPRGGAAAMRL